MCRWSLKQSSTRTAVDSTNQSPRDTTMNTSCAMSIVRRQKLVSHSNIQWKHAIQYNNLYSTQLKNTMTWRDRIIASRTICEALESWLNTLVLPADAHNLSFMQVRAQYPGSQCKHCKADLKQVENCCGAAVCTVVSGVTQSHKNTI